MYGIKQQPKLLITSHCGQNIHHTKESEILCTTGIIAGRSDHSPTFVYLMSYLASPPVVCQPSDRGSGLAGPHGWIRPFRALHCTVRSWSAPDCWISRHWGWSGSSLSTRFLCILVHNRRTSLEADKSRLIEIIWHSTNKQRSKKIKKQTNRNK